MVESLTSPAQAPGRVGYAGGRTGLSVFGVKLFDFLLIFGWILSPMTGLRVWKAGPGEVLCLLWCLRQIRLLGPGRDILKSFWFPYLICTALGFLYCGLYWPDESAGYAGLLTWVFMAVISTGILNGLRAKNRAEIERLVRIACVLGTLWYAFIYLYSRQVSPTLLGARLWYGRVRFTGGGDNPHQIAGYCAGVLFLLAYLLFRTKNSVPRRALILSCAAANLFFIVETRSTTTFMAIAASACFGAVALFAARNPSREARRRLYLRVTVLAFAVLVFFFNRLLALFLDWVAADPNGPGRFRLFSYIWDAFRKSPFFGLGPGTHSAGGVSEFHNSYLEVLAMAGLFGLALFARYSVRFFKNLSVDPMLMLAPLSLYIYGLAGFGLRRLPYWVISGLLLALAEKIFGDEAAPPPGAEPAMKKSGGTRIQ